MTDLFGRTDTKLRIARVWAMASARTFSIPPIREFVARYACGIVVDPFAGDNPYRLKWSNDLNPAKPTTHHIDSADFLSLLERSGVMADTVLFDPPYSPRQVKECYEGFGRKPTAHDTNRTGAWKAERDVIARILRPGGHVLSFGWNSMGVGKGRGFELVEVLLVSHGSAHNDTICVAERRPE